MPEDPFDDNPPPQPTTPPQAPPAPPAHAPLHASNEASVLCPGCGVILKGVRIGSSCPTCGELIGSQRNLHGNLPSSGKATASLVLGIISIPGCLLYGIPALVCGILAVVFAKQARADIDSGLYNPASRSSADAGRICGLIGLILGIVGIVLLVAYIIFFAWFVTQANNPNSPFMTPPSNQQTTPQPPTYQPSQPSGPRP